MIYGNARISTIDQDLSIQHAALAAAGCTVVRSEKVTGTSTQGREGLATLLQFLREGDTLVVTRIDRLARSLRDLQNIVHGLRQRGVILKATGQPIEYQHGRGEVLPRHAGSIRRVRDEPAQRAPDGRHREGKGERIYASKGRPASVDAVRVREMRAQGLGPTAIAKALGIGRASATGSLRMACLVRCRLQASRL